MKFYIKEILKRKGRTYQNLADDLGISLSAVKQMINAKSLTTATLEKIAFALEVSVLELLSDDAPTLPTAGGSSAGGSSAGSISCPWCGSPLSLQVGKGNKVTKDDAAKTKDK